MQVRQCVAYTSRERFWRCIARAQRCPRVAASHQRSRGWLQVGSFSMKRTNVGDLTCSDVAAL